MMDDHDMSHDEDIQPVDAPAALRALDDVVAPDRLRLAVERAVADAEPGRASGLPGLFVRRRPGLAFLRAAAVPLAIVVVLAIVAVSVIDGGGTSTPSPTVHDVVQAALRPVAAPAPAVRPGGELLRAHVGPIAFPTWTHVGWRAVGARSDTLGGRELRTVFYADARGRRIGYAIADARLPAAGGRVVTWRGARIHVLDRGPTAVVTWRRDGRTCVLAGRGVPVDHLLRLARYADA